MQNQQMTHVVPPYLSQWYHVECKIGEGTFGVVYLARSKANRSRLLAIKTIKPGKESDGVSPTAIRELMLRELKHEHLIHLDSVHINRKDPCLSLAFDYADHDLYGIISYHRERLRSAPISPFTVKSLMWQLLNGLSYLEQNWVMHRDLKPSNILVMGEGPEQGKVKIGDFGLARFVREPLCPLSENGVVVTIWYRAPELLLGAKHYTSAVDMWAAGCIMAELLMLRPLFPGEEDKRTPDAFQQDQLHKIFRVLGHPTPKVWPNLEHHFHWANNTGNIRLRKPDAGGTTLQEHVRSVAGGHSLLQGGAALDLLAQLLTYDPDQRCTAQRALRHPFFSEEPLPGPNAFRSKKSTVAQYPPRVRLTGGSQRQHGV